MVDEKQVNAQPIHFMMPTDGMKILAHAEKIMQIHGGEIPVPVVAELFLTNFCDFSCGHCRCRSEHGDNTEYMSLDSLTSLLEELANKGIKYLELSGGGEILVHPDIYGVFDAIGQYGFRGGLITNGNRFVEEPSLIDAAVPHLDWIRFSVDGFTDAVYQRVHGREDISYSALKEVVKGLAQHDVPKISIKMLISKHNAQDVDKAISEARNMGADYIDLRFLTFPEKLVLPEADVREISNILKGQIAEVDDFKVELSQPYGGDHPPSKCLGTYLHPVVDWDGTIYLCPFFSHRAESHSIGNIHDGGFFKHWFSEDHKKAFEAVNHKECVPNCPMMRYQPVIDFLASPDAYTVWFP